MTANLLQRDLNRYLGDPVDDSHIQIVNVASVRQLSPFRYPGGKTWLLPVLRRWIKSLPQPLLFTLEPFAGGASFSLAVAAEKLAPAAHMTELDYDVATVWRIITSWQADELARRVESFECTPASVTSALAREPQDSLDRAFITLLRNRVARGGIMAPGAGVMKSGESGNGIASRWYPRTLARRIRAVHQVSDRLWTRHGDGLEEMRRYASYADIATFIDPPYTATSGGAGHRLYLHNEVDHDALFALAASMAGPVLLTYDDTPEVRAMAARYGFDVTTVPMKSAHNQVKRELLIGREIAHVIGERKAS